MPENITFRTQLIGGVAEFCHSCQLSIFSDTLTLVELVVKLARYQEEGVRLCPKVYLTNNIERLDSLLPGGETLKIGNASPNAEGINEALKKCAPLAADGWLLYIKSDIDNIEYGLFRGSENPISVLVDDILMTPEEDLKIVKVFQVADECVEIRSNNGEYHYIFLDHRKEDAKPPLHYINNLISTITYSIASGLKEPTTSFLKKLFFDSLRQSHGCLIAVTSMNKPPKFLAEDGVILDRPIDFPNLILRLKSGNIPPTHLESKGTLLKGMLNSDGILLFDTKGRLLGYNCFIKINKKDDVVGGARRRAYTALKSKVGKGLKSAFMQSQDGWSNFYGDIND